MDKGTRVKAIALRILVFLGIPVPDHKTEWPATLLSFLGILIDKQAFQLRISVEKIHCLRSLITSMAFEKGMHSQRVGVIPSPPLTHSISGAPIFAPTVQPLTGG